MKTVTLDDILDNFDKNGNPVIEEIGGKIYVYDNRDEPAYTDKSVYFVAYEAGEKVSFEEWQEYKLNACDGVEIHFPIVKDGLILYDTDNPYVI